MFNFSYIIKSQIIKSQITVMLSSQTGTKRKSVMFRRTALKALFSLTTASLLIFNNPQKSYAGSDAGSSGGSGGGGSSSGNDDSSSGGSSSSGGGSSSGNDDSSSGGSSSRRGGSSRGGSSSSDGGSSASSPSGPDDVLTGDDASDTDSQDDLLRRLDQSLQSDGLETVTSDNLQSTLDAFK